MRRTNRILTGISLLAMASAVQGGGTPAKAVTTQERDPIEQMAIVDAAYGPPVPVIPESHTYGETVIVAGTGVVALATVIATLHKMSREDDGDTPMGDGTAEETISCMQQLDEEIETDVDSPVDSNEPERRE